MRTIHTVFLLATAIAVTAPVAGMAEASVAQPAHGRAWELITPPDPNGAPISAVHGVTPGGDRVAYSTVGPLPGSQAGSLRSPSFAKRSPLGWTSVPIALPYSVEQFSFGFGAPQLAGANEEMTRWIWSSNFPLTPDGPPSGRSGLYSREGIDAAPTLIAAVASGFEFSGASLDMRRLVFQSGSVLLPEDVRTSGKQVYASTAAGLRLAGVDSAGNPLSACGATVGSPSYPPNPVSRDGGRIFISSPDAPCSGETKRVYLREDGATTEISASRCTHAAPACNGPADVRFMGATPSGSVAFMATAQQLTDDDRDDSTDLYRYDVAAGALSRVSVGPSGVSAAVTTTAAYPSEDGSRVYFLASGQLVPGKGVAGGYNVYVHDDQGLRFVATIAGGDGWRVGASLTDDDDVQLTPDGTRLVFTTTAALTADDADMAKDVYLYDVDDATLERLSGLPGTGNGAFAADIGQTSSIQPTAGYRPRSLSLDGRRVFFLTDESLIPEDGNATTDVYEWADGDLGLVSSGGAGTVVRYHAATADGRSVLFSTDESLTPDDGDGGYSDLYVARIGGGFPVREQAPPPACPDGCAPKPAERLSRKTPATVGFVETAASRLSVLPISSVARRRMAASGWLELRIRTGLPGRIAARARAGLGRGAKTVASGAIRATRPGVVRLRLRLSPPARRRLDEGHALLVRVVLRRSRPHRSTSFSLELEPPR